MEKSEGRKSASQDTSENGMENPGLELMVFQYGGLLCGCFPRLWIPWLHG